MDQQVKTLDAKPDNLHSVPGPTWRKRESRLLSSCPQISNGRSGTTFTLTTPSMYINAIKSKKLKQKRVYGNIKILSIIPGDNHWCFILVTLCYSKKKKHRYSRKFLLQKTKRIKWGWGVGGSSLSTSSFLLLKISMIPI